MLEKIAVKPSSLFMVQVAFLAKADRLGYSRGMG